MQKDENKGGKKQLSAIPAQRSIVLNCALPRYMNISCVDKFYFMVTMSLRGEVSIIILKIKELEKNGRR